MRIFLGIIGLIAALAVWNSGHPFVAVIVGFLLIGGVGWVLPLWLARAVATPRIVQPAAHDHLDDLLAEWRRRGLGERPPMDLAAMYLNGRGSLWPDAAGFLDMAGWQSRADIGHSERNKMGD